MRSTGASPLLLLTAAGLPTRLRGCRLTNDGATFDVLPPVEPGAAEGGFREFPDGVRFPRGDDEIVGLRPASSMRIIAST